MILDAINRRGKPIRCYIAITPLIDKEIEGVVLMMVDIEKIKSMISAREIEGRRQQHQE